MGKKKGNGLSTHSMRFADYVTDAQTDKLKPFIQGQVQQMGQRLAQSQLAAMADVLTRTSVLEDLATNNLKNTLTGTGLLTVGAALAFPAYSLYLGIATMLAGLALVLSFTTRKALAVKLVDKEDESTGLKASRGPAKAGDMLRVTIQGRGENDKKFGNPTPMRIRKLLHQPYTLNKELEEGLVGVKSGQTKIIPYKVTNKVKNQETGELEDKEFNYTFKVRVDRISVPKNPPRPAPSEQKSSEQTTEAKTPKEEAKKEEVANA